MDKLLFDSTESKAQRVEEAKQSNERERLA